MVHIKAVLEGYAALQSVYSVEDATLAKLRQYNAQMREAQDKGDYKLYSTLNMKFHLAIYECGPHKELYRMICDVWKKWSITKTVFELAPESAMQSTGEHDVIIEMLENKNDRDIEMYVRNHKLRAGDSLVKRLPKSE
jgi:DNA-binding GntR family transcriptional regulator